MPMTDAMIESMIESMIEAMTRGPICGIGPLVIDGEAALTVAQHDVSMGGGGGGNRTRVR